MTDFELLEYAAKACGYNINHPWNEHRKSNEPHLGLCIDTESTNWNPLKNDGQALRLAFKLRIDIEWQHIGYVPTDEVECYVSGDSNWYKTFLDKAENYKRAIVECAAEIGKAMP